MLYQWANSTDVYLNSFKLWGCKTAVVVNVGVVKKGILNLGKLGLSKGDCITEVAYLNTFNLGVVRIGLL